MKHILLYTILLQLVAFPSFAQQYYSKFYTHNGYRSNAVNVIARSNDYIVANTYRNSTVSNGISILSFSYNGELNWLRNHNIGNIGVYSSEFGQFISTQDGGFAFATFKPISSYWWDNIYFMKFDSIGNLEWNRDYGEPQTMNRAFALMQNNAGDYVMCGFASSSGPGTADTYVLKTSVTNGDTLWTKRFVIDSFQRAQSISEDYDGAYLMGSFTAVSNSSESDGTSDGDGLIYKLNADGSVRWMLNIGTPDDDCDAYIVPCKTEPGKYYVWSCDGKSHPAFPNDEVEGKSYYISKIDSIGNVYWRTPMSGYSKGIKKAIEMPSGKILLVGSDTFCADETNWCFSYWGWMALLDSSGIVLWDRTFYLYNEDEAYGFAWLTDAIPTPDGGFIAVGRYPIQIEPPTVAPAVPHVWLLKVDENGCITPGCNEELIFVSVNDGQFILFENDTAELPIFPNPATYTISIHTKQPWQNLFLYNLHGQEVASYYPPNPLHNLPLPENLPNGLYIAQLTLNNGTIQTTKLLISK